MSVGVLGCATAAPRRGERGSSWQLFVGRIRHGNVFRVSFTADSRGAGPSFSRSFSCVRDSGRKPQLLIDGRFIIAYLSRSYALAAEVTCPGRRPEVDGCLGQPSLGGIVRRALLVGLRAAVGSHLVV